MTKPTLFWIACATTLFALSLVVFHQRLDRRNSLFAAWLCLSVSAQLVAAWGLAAHRPRWFAPAGQLFGVATLGLAIAALAVALGRAGGCETNRTIALGLGAMILFDLVAAAPGLAGVRTELGPQTLAWLRNIAFFGPCLYMLAIFSGAPPNLLPLPARPPAVTASSELAAGATASIGLRAPLAETRPGETGE